MRHAVLQLVEKRPGGYGGLEFAEGIPGTIGGALFMNAGAYGSEFEKIIDRVDGTLQEGELIRLSRNEMTFTYRDSHLPAGMVVTAARLRLRRKDAAKVTSRVRELVTKRKTASLPATPTRAPCFVIHRRFCWRLIEAAGLKGKKIGHAQISERHGNAIVNLGGAKGEDVRRLMELARAEVQIRLASNWSLKFDCSGIGRLFRQGRNDATDCISQRQPQNKAGAVGVNGSWSAVLLRL